MTFTDSDLRSVSGPIAQMAGGILASLGGGLVAGDPHDGSDLSAPLVPERPAAGVSASLVGEDGTWAGRLVLAASESSGIALVEGGEPTAGVAEAILVGLRTVDELTGSLLADQLCATDAAAGLDGIRRDGDPAPVVVPFFDGDRHVVSVAVVLATPVPVAADLPLLPDAPPPVDRPARSINTLGDVALAVTVELGRTELPLRALLGLHPGAVIQLDRAVSSPVDIYANGTKIGRGEMVVVDNDYGVRITELVEGD